MDWQNINMSEFLTARTTRYKPNDKVISGLKRIDKIDFSGNIMISDKPTNTDMILIKKGDLVISGINVSKGAMSIYQGADDILATIHYSSYIFDRTKIDIDFLMFFLKSSSFTNILQEQVQGGIKTELKPKHILSLKVKIPIKISDQKKIVKFLKEITTLNEKLFDEQVYQINTLKKLRQLSFLDAFTGKLTEKMRLRSNQIEQASELLKRVKQEKYETNKNYYGKKNKTILQISKNEVPFDLPYGWTWCRLGDIITFGPTNGYSPIESKKGQGVKCLTLTATTSGFFKDNCFKYVDEVISDDSYLWLKNNDILLQRGNSIDYVGIAAIYEGNNNEYIYPDLMIKIQVHALISAKYVYYVLLSPFSRNYYMKNASGAQKSMPKINQSVVINTLIPLPPANEQLLIVDKINFLLSLYNSFQNDVEKQLLFSKYLLNIIFNNIFNSNIL